MKHKKGTKKKSRKIKILVITPEPKESLKGNFVTAFRWARFLRELGYRVIVDQTYKGQSYDLMVALHARRSFSSIEQFYNSHNEKPIIVVLTGTDLYMDVHANHNAQKSLKFADRLVVLQQMGINELPEKFREKTRVIYQSAVKQKGNVLKRKKTFDICVIGHLRQVKDPFCTAMASRILPDSSKVRILHIGSALDKNFELMANNEMSENPRYCWKGAQPHWKTIRILRSCQLLVLSSQMEGGANVISEAIISGVPVLSTKISGSIGMLGEGYPGYFPVGDTKALAGLILRAENDPRFIKKLRQWITSIASTFKPVSEKLAIKKLLLEFYNE